MTVVQLVGRVLEEAETAEASRLLELLEGLRREVGFLEIARDQLEECARLLEAKLQQRRRDT